MTQDKIVYRSHMGYVTRSEFIGLINVNSFREGLGTVISIVMMT